MEINYGSEMGIDNDFEIDFATFLYMFEGMTYKEARQKAISDIREDDRP